MINPKMACPKCKSAMEEGFIADFTERGGVKVSNWIEGEPEKSFWRGIKTKGREKLPVTTYRCVRCGYLVSYALPSQD